MDDFLAQRRAFNAKVNEMTNWQRHQWNRAGSPGLIGREIELVQPYIDNKRPEER